LKAYTSLREKGLGTKKVLEVLLVLEVLAVRRVLEVEGLEVKATLFP
jgi:hypothetical protein